MTRMSKFVEQLANYVRFEIHVIAKRKLDVERKVEEKKKNREESRPDNALRNMKSIKDHNKALADRQEVGTKDRVPSDMERSKKWVNLLSRASICLVF